jgi:hypothetical protein
LTAEVPLGRLLAYRRAGPDDVARAAGVTAAELTTVLTGGDAGAELLRRLAPVLGLRTADMFVIAGHDVPDDLAAASGTVTRVDRLLRAALRLYDRDFDRLHEVVRSLPDRPPVAAPPTGTGTVVAGLLTNRNLRPYIARELCQIGGGPYVSPSTVAMVVRGRLPMTSRYVTAFAALLGFDAGDLAALTGAGLTGEISRPLSRHAHFAALAWDARRLDDEQLTHVLRTASTFRGARS